MEVGGIICGNQPTEIYNRSDLFAPDKEQGRVWGAKTEHLLLASAYYVPFRQTEQVKRSGNRLVHLRARVLVLQSLPGKPQRLLFSVRLLPW